MAIDYKGYSSLGRDGCKCAAFHGCSCLYRETECHFGSAAATPRKTVSGKNPSKDRPLRRIPGPIARAALLPAGLSQLAAPLPGQPPPRHSPPEDEGRKTRRPTGYQETKSDRRRAAHSRQPSCSATKQGQPLARRRPPEEGPVDDDAPIDHPRSRSTPAACPERRPRAPTARRPRPTANWWTASGANGSTASLHQCRRRT